ncbi:hypothetical protein ACWGR4_30700 [Embleya sp. NPDC055664]
MFIAVETRRVHLGEWGDGVLRVLSALRVPTGEAAHPGAVEVSTVVVGSAYWSIWL